MIELVQLVDPPLPQVGDPVAELGRLDEPRRFERRDRVRGVGVDRRPERFVRRPPLDAENLEKQLHCPVPLRARSWSSGKNTPRQDRRLRQPDTLDAGAGARPSMGVPGC